MAEVGHAALDFSPWALSSAGAGSGRGCDLLSSRRRRAIQKRPVIDPVSEHDIEADQELPRDSDLRTGTATPLEHSVVEPLEFRIASNRRVTRLAERYRRRALPCLLMRPSRCFPAEDSIAGASPT